MGLEMLARHLREFEGVSRKKPIAEIFKIFESVRHEYGNVIADFGDDAAVIDTGGDDVILFAADGIWGRIVEKSPWWTGYTSVVVNVNDISAMGGKPLAMVNIMSSSDPESIKGIMEGIRDGVNKFGVPMVGGHTHPDTPYNSLAVAIIGTAKKDCLIRSDTAIPGDIVVFAYDMDGRVGKNSPYSWDTTSFKDPQFVRECYLVMVTIAERKLVTAGKDISNPGSIGTLGMLCETSKVGACVDLAKIPRPENMDLEQWLKIYPATGYVVTVKPENVQECLQTFSQVGLTAAAVGEITDSKLVEIQDQNEKAIVFDLTKDVITGIGE
ncbi:putative methanogenesis marker protein 2 [Methanomethylovorans hollandica DSM 15978]|uniref:Putative methanogenesis marker protein 2 n=1 Tax=Methanomethylovorans hollandica (strain DSM 15978 / NBRC 107637 / DMS1) TaxID=867904 RepID=L0KY13_METHD|nr:methanogenesis marker 2 protein [Methanomethylovorans hollandica]AGB50011.1 putative methanogenesis marker protein 2 [Methanomethylovorans hollandica DSM 15978]